MKIQAVILGLIMNSSNEIFYLLYLLWEATTPDHFFRQIGGGIEFSSPTHVAMQCSMHRSVEHVTLLSYLPLEVFFRELPINI